MPRAWKATTGLAVHAAAAAVSLLGAGGCSSSDAPAGAPGVASATAKASIAMDGGAAAQARIAELRARWVEVVPEADAGVGPRYPRTVAPGMATAAPSGPRSVIGDPVATGFELTGSGKVHPLTPAPARHSSVFAANVELPAKATGAVSLRDAKSGVAIAFTLAGARHDSGIEIGNGLVLYRDALGPGGDIVHRPRTDGTEDFVSVPSRPASEELRYTVDVTAVPGLRMVTNVLEMLDATGTPRLRMAPPYVVDANGVRYAARVEVSGCAYDRSSKAPWEREVTAPNASSCDVRISWSGSGAAYPLIVDPAWTTTGSMTIPRDESASAYIATSPARVILVSYGSGELYGVASKTWASAGATSAYYYRVTATPLLDGRVLFTSGRQAGDVFDPTNDQFTVTQPMSLDREGVTATLLESGKVLVTGGAVYPTYFSSAELYDPSSNSFTPTTGSMTTARGDHAAVRLPSGKVFIVGGYSAPNTPLDTAELYDPATETFTAITARTTTPRVYHAVTLLDSGKVLIVGANGPGRNLAELFDPAAGSFVATDSLNAAAGAYPTLTLLPDGRVLTTYDQTSDLYEPTSGIFLPAGAMPSSHFAYSNSMATLLPGGVVLAAGGREPSTGAALATCDLFMQAPAGDTCTGKGASGECESLLCNGGVCCSGPCADPCTTCQAGTGACQLVSSADDPDSCTSAQTCSFLGECKKKTGQTCTALGDCASGYCVDGYCCGSDCSSPCNECFKTPGTCNPVKSSDDGTACSGNNTCDGSGVCKKKAAQSCTSAGQCASGYCKDGVCCGSACSAACQTCSATPGLCTPVASKTDSPECSGTQTCNSVGQCKTALGQACSLGSDCATGYCVDGVCCNTACNSGTCMACKGSLTGGADGTCANALIGTDPHDDCTESAPVGDKCANNGQCNGSGDCQHYPAGTQCADAACTGASTLKAVTTCDTSGACTLGGGTTSCLTGYACVNGACVTSCSGNGDCVLPYTCNNGFCKLPLGAACTGPGECVNGICSTDGVCCDTACTGTCEACVLVKTGQASGTCAPVTGGTDPDGECVDDGSSSCDRNGLCNGARACQLYGASTVCAAASCATATSEDRADTCDGSGTCTVNGITPCQTGYACVGTACKASCTLDTDCASGYVCSSGQCLLANGQGCGGNSACATGFCVDGFCCNEACAGECRACSAAKKGSGTSGTCGSIASDSDPDNECPTDSGYPNSCKQDGFCDGTGQCRPNAKSTVACGVTACSGGSSVTGSLCDGTGACQPATTTSCSPYRCTSGSCTTSCLADTDCVSGAYCTTLGTCADKKTSGNCGGANECQSGYCVDGVCCDTACDRPCEACAEPASPGTCTTVSGAPRAPRTQCAGSGQCAGTCNGTDPTACTYDSTTTCVAASCATGSQTTASKCDGAGACSTPVTTSCNAYACGATACKTSCAGVGDCAIGYWCVASQCLPIGGGVDAGAGGNAGADAGAGGSAGADAGTGGNGNGGAGAGGSANGGAAAGGSTGADAGTGGSGFTEPRAKDSGGCGCRVAETRREGSASALALVAGLVGCAWRGRRGSRRRERDARERGARAPEQSSR